MTLKEYYEICKEEEKERSINPTCYNCRNCYREYGQDLCKVNDFPTDDYKKCACWK